MTNTPLESEKDGEDFPTNPIPANAEGGEADADSAGSEENQNS